MPDIILQPKQGEVYDLVDHGQASWIGAPGGRGGAKSGGIQRIMMLRRMEIPGTPGAIVMRNQDQVVKYHKDVMERTWPELANCWKAQDYKYVLPAGDGLTSEIHLMWADSLADVIRRFRSASFFDIFVDQAEQFTEIELREMKQANRWAGSKPKPCRFVLAFNMGGVGIDFLRDKFHFKKYNQFEHASDFSYVHFFPWDNVEWVRDALSRDGFTARDYYSWPVVRKQDYCAQNSDYCRSLVSQDEALRKRDWFGSWDSFEGAFFARVFDRDKTVIEPERILKLIEPWSKRWISQDWGKGHYCVTQWHASINLSPQKAFTVLGWKIPMPLELAITYREYIAGGAAAPDEGGKRQIAESDIAAEVANLTPEAERRYVEAFYLSPDAFEMSVTREGLPEIAQMEGEVLRRRGLPYPCKANNARKDGWSLMYDALAATSREGFTEKMEVAPYAWVISADCPELVKSIPLLQRDPKNLDDVLKTDKESAKLDQDCGDTARYGLKSGLSPNQKPYSVQLREAVKEAIGDPEMPNYNLAHQVHMRMEEQRRKQIENMQGRSQTMRIRMRRYVK